ncbi:prohibitin-1, mitochondrial-like protein isoform X1 [Tanacetum coccineum]
MWGEEFNFSVDKFPVNVIIQVLFKKLDCLGYRKLEIDPFCSLETTRHVSMITITLLRMSLGVLTRPVADELPTVYQTLGENYNERVLPSIIQETLKVVASFKGQNDMQLMWFVEPIKEPDNGSLVVQAGSLLNAEMCAGSIESPKVTTNAAV